MSRPVLSLEKCLVRSDLKTGMQLPSSPGRKTFFVMMFALLGLFLLEAKLALAEISVEPHPDRVTVKIDGKLFTEYLTQSGTKPVLWPVIGPMGHRMTREYPMAEAKPEEREDHIHHRSIWFTHGDVNGHDFWAERKDPAVIKHREFVKVQGGNQAVIVTRNDWLAPDGKKVLEDERTVTFGADGESRWIDFDITLKATEESVTFGDTKEGCMGIRVAAPLKPDAKLGGLLINSKGQKNKEAWGKAAAWVDYSGKLGGDEVGVAIFNHPSSFRFPTYWHARTYGLCSGNPFGKSYFVGKGQDGSHTLKPGESITLRYRFFFHKGDVREGGVAEAYQAYASRKK